MEAIRESGGGGLTGFGVESGSDSSFHFFNRISPAKGPETSGAGYIGIGARLQRCVSVWRLLWSATCVRDGTEGPDVGPLASGGEWYAQAAGAVELRSPMVVAVRPEELAAGDKRIWTIRMKYSF